MKPQFLFTALAVLFASGIAHAETFEVVKGIAIRVHMPKVSLTKHMFLTKTDQLLTLSCSVPIWPWASSQILYVDVYKSSDRVVVGQEPNSDLAPHQISTHMLASFEECKQTIDTLMTATVSSPISFSIVQDGAISLVR